MLSFIRQSLRFCAGSVFSFALWTLWLALAALLVLQAYIYSTSELAVPGFLLRRAEARLAASGLNVTFSSTSFDPQGRVLIENVRARLPTFEESVFTARAVYCRLNPWMLAVGRLEVRDLQIMDATVWIPAMLSPSGRPEKIIRNLEAVITPEARQFQINQLSARIAGVVVSASGIVPAPSFPAAGPTDPIGWLTRNFAGLCRQALAVREQLADFEEPSINLESSLSPTGALVVNMELLARQARFAVPVAAEASDVRVTARALLLGQASILPIDFSARELKLPFGSTARQVRARVIGSLGADAGFQFVPRQLDVTAEVVTSNGFAATDVWAQLFPRPLPRIDARIVAQIAGAPLAVEAEADLNAQTARIDFRGAIAPSILTPLSERLQVDLRRFFDFASLVCQEGSLQLGAGWTFERLRARVDAEKIIAYGVRLDEGHAVVELDPTRFYSPEAYGTIGANFARGSYEQDLQTRQFRLLLEGRLRPLDVSGWFRPWWSGFFAQFEFPNSPPAAAVDVRGVWSEGRRTAVFIRLASDQAVVRGAAFQNLRTRLYVQPNRFDGLEVSAASGGGIVQGKFSYTTEPGTNAWRTLDLNLNSTLDLPTVTRVMGALGERVFSPYRLSAAPTVGMRGSFAGPTAPGGRSQSVDAEIRTTGELRFLQFPVRDPTFQLKIRDDDLEVTDLTAAFATGVLAGQIRVSGSEPRRRVGFNLALKDASLGDSVFTLQTYFAQKRGEPPPLPGKFIQEKANVRADVAATAEGDYGNPYSFQGKGTAVLRGAEIGAVPLLGNLSELVTFTALRFTDARGEFIIDGARLQFPEVTLRGANSAIDAHGTYALAARQLDFRAKVFPFQESSNLVKSVVGAVLTSLSNALEVKLSGSLEKPEWEFALLSTSPSTLDPKAAESGALVPP